MRNITYAVKLSGNFEPLVFFVAPISTFQNCLHWKSGYVSISFFEIVRSAVST